MTGPASIRTVPPMKMFGAVLVAILALAACGGGGDDDSKDAAKADGDGKAPPTTASVPSGGSDDAQATPKACDVLTEAVAKQILGPSAANIAGASTDKNCLYDTGMDDGSLKHLELYVRDDTGIGYFDEEEDAGATNVAGFGDAAHFTEDDMLAVRKGHNVYEIECWRTAQGLPELDDGEREAEKRTASLLKFS
jgi:hypothetical protein